MWMTMWGKWAETTPCLFFREISQKSEMLMTKMNINTFGVAPADARSLRRLRAQFNFCVHAMPHI